MTGILQAEELIIIIIAIIGFLAISAAFIAIVLEIYDTLREEYNERRRRKK